MHFFVIGSGRCGTTMLWKMLNLSPDLFVFRETHWHPKLFEHFGLGEGPPAEMLNIVERTCFVEGHPTTAIDDALRATLATLGDSVSVRRFSDAIGQHFAAQAGKTVWADKTPDYASYLDTLQLLFSDTKIVHLVRDGRDVARSMSYHPGYRWLATAGEVAWAPGSFNGYASAITAEASTPLGVYATLWRRRIQLARDGATRLAPGAYREYRYEDLLARPSEMLKDMAQFVDIPLTPQWLEQAALIPDPAKLAPSSGPEVPMGPAEIELQADLGYGAA
ncbi:MAG: hypothetical protein ACI9EF_000514 [Pseudohongiellaceae bacterium]|jgi:hypothetical protein